jgi:hypothetical protein
LAGDNSLSGLTVTPGALAPPFDKNLLNYTVSVDNNIGSISVTPTLSDPLATMTVNGESAGSDQARAITLRGGGQVTPITIIVTAQDRSTKSYEIAVSRGASNNNNLSALTVSPGTLTFRATTTAYTVNVDSDVARVAVRPTLADTSATMTVNGQAATSGQSQTIGLNPAGGSPTNITIIVIAQNGSAKPYSVAINRAGNNNLSELTVSSGSLSPSFRADRTAYTVNVGSSVTSVTVRPTLADTSATMTVNGQAATSGQSQTIGLGNPGPATTVTVTIIVFATNQPPKQYSVTINRAALDANNNLSALTVSPGTLDTPFSATDLSYTVSVGSDVGSVRVRPTLAESTTATMTVNGQPVTSGQQSAPITLNPAGGQPTNIQIVVTAQNQTTKTYSVTVVRAAPSSNTNLSALRLTAGSSVTNFSSPFASNTVTVAPEIEEVVVRATKEDANATMAIGGATVPPGTPSGQATFTLNGAGGPATTISFTVTPQSGVGPKTYTITVNRPAAPTKPDAPDDPPDLLTEDDSCQLVPDSTLCFAGSNTDNLTNVKRPGFSVPAPSSGLTAKLYITKTTGKEFPSSSTSAGNTLIFRPNEDLEDGSYNVSYTLSNSVGESEKSDPMEPALIIDTTAPTP